MRPVVSVRCVDCTLEFQRRADYVPKGADGAVRCKACAYKAIERRTDFPEYLRGENVPCAQCDLMVYKRRSVIARTQRQFCSMSCLHAWNAEHMSGLIAATTDNSGSRNPMFKDGKRVGQHARYDSKTKVRKLVIERDGGDWCLFCGRPGPGLHLHRVRYGSQGGRYEVSNCVQLCVAHHELVHSDKRLWQPQLLGHLDGSPFRWSH